MAVVLHPGDLYAGNIKVLSVLGSGAFANVYKVEVRGYDRPLALKLTREPVTTSDAAQRALREITILRSLTNPHVVRTFDCGLRPDGTDQCGVDPEGTSASWDGPPSDERFVQLGLGEWTGCGITVDGRVVCFDPEYASDGECDPPELADLQVR